MGKGLRLDLLVECHVGKDIIKEHVRHQIPLRHVQHREFLNRRLQRPLHPIPESTHRVTRNLGKKTHSLHHQHPCRIRLPLCIGERGTFHHIHHRAAAEHVPRGGVLCRTKTNGDERSESTRCHRESNRGKRKEEDVKKDRKSAVEQRAVAERTSLRQRPRRTNHRPIRLL